MAGTWQGLRNPANFNVDTMLLLTYGIIMCHETDSNRWHRLTPDAIGDYVNGQWLQLPLMADNPSIPTSKGGPTYAPRAFVSAVLADGRVLVAGGEYNNGQPTQTPNIPISDEISVAEIYDPANEGWTIVNSNYESMGDSPSCVLPDGRVLIGLSGMANTTIFDPALVVRPATGAEWISAAYKGPPDSSSEETFTLLPNNTILTVQCQNPGM